MNDLIEEARAQGFRDGLEKAAKMADVEALLTSREDLKTAGEIKIGVMRALDLQARRLRALAATKP